VQKKAENAARMAEKVKKAAEKERQRVVREMKKGAMALHMIHRVDKKKEAERNRNYLVNFLSSKKRADVSKRGENTNTKFVLLEPKYGVKYARPQCRTLGPFLEIFAEESFDFISEQLLKYRVHESKKLTSRSEGRRPWKWSYRHFSTDHRRPWSGVEKRASCDVHGRRPFVKGEEDIDYEEADSGVEWYDDVLEGKEMLCDNEEGEWIDEELESFSDDEMQEGLRPDGYEDDGFLSDDKNIYFQKVRRKKKEERYPIKLSRGRGGADIRPIILHLPKCEHYNENKKTDAELHKFIKSCAGLRPCPNAEIQTDSRRRTPPPFMKNWLRKIKTKKMKRDEGNVLMLKPQKKDHEKKQLKRKRKETSPKKKRKTSPKKKRKTSPKKKRKTSPKKKRKRETLSKHKRKKTKKTK